MGKTFCEKIFIGTNGEEYECCRVSNHKGHHSVLIHDKKWFWIKEKK